MALIAFLALSLLLNGALGELVCEQLPVDLCSYSIATSGKRCLLENYATKDGGVKYQCKTSEVVVGILNEWIEIDECITACGLSRNTVGISSDSLLQPQFLTKLCSQSCSQACGLAYGRVYLPNLCANPRRAMYQTRSNGDAAPAPVSIDALSPEYAVSGADYVACAPTYI
ncbi:PREDICTED: uncharacterized protein LOC105131157 [Populus euphratica]|uniref:Uncharacterized protein LOC105131157 n=1 Tax=Populus euphratica TaxID=75702 RepID=A0AAJ6XV86_POPEU|nr:PREDICTED: uncharacterized protein LOC105131157 [Populus euphratica]